MSPTPSTTDSIILINPETKQTFLIDLDNEFPINLVDIDWLKTLSIFLRDPSRNVPLSVVAYKIEKC